MFATLITYHLSICPPPGLLCVLFCGNAETPRGPPYLWHVSVFLSILSGDEMSMDGSPFRPRKLSPSMSADILELPLPLVGYSVLYVSFMFASLFVGLLRLSL